MLTYKEAVEKILEHTFPLMVKKVKLKGSLGLVAAKDLVSPEPFPRFNNSAVDGYAVSLLDCLHEGEKIKLKVRGEIRAGECFESTLKRGEAVRIFTGAPVPLGTQAVVMQEHAERVNGHVFLLKEPKLKDNIRFKGEDFRKGMILVKQGTVIGPAQVAVLAAVGYKSIPVYPAPKVAILATGSELLQAGEKCKPGKIRDSNTVLLESLVKEIGGIPFALPSAADNPVTIRTWIRKGLRSDLFLISGGVSVGKYDFVREVLKEEEVKEIFWKVNIKPGKPLFFGRKGRTLIFGLPGNPVSVFVTFEEFVKPAIFQMMGKSERGKRVQGRLTEPFQNGPRLHFVRVSFVQNTNGYRITPLKGQGSHMIGALAQANGLLKVEPNEKLKKNESVSVKIIREG